MQSCSAPPTPDSRLFTFRDTSLWLPGSTVRVSLSEIQKADVGRKFARIDRRPLDPPPVARIRCYYVYPSPTGEGTVEEEIHDYDERLTLGLLCHVDLFPVQDPQTTSFQGGIPSGSTPLPPFPFQSDMSSRSSSYPATQFSSQQPVFLPSSPTSTTDRRAAWNIQPKAQQTDIGNPVHSEDSICTALLAGQTFVHCSIIDYQGSPAAVFVFSDLAVRLEGRYFLRYQVLNVLAATWDSDVPVLAKCYGGSFQIFSTKAFPGLQPSTELTRKLSIAGLRVNARAQKRTRSEIIRADDARSAPSTSSSSSSGTNPSHTPGPTVRSSQVLSGNPGEPPALRIFAGSSPYTPFAFFAPPRPLTPPPSLLEWATRSGELRDMPRHDGGSYPPSGTGTDAGSSTQHSR